jgi:hypothetical protein
MSNQELAINTGGIVPVNEKALDRQVGENEIAGRLVRTRGGGKIEVVDNKTGASIIIPVEEIKAYFGGDEFAVKLKESMEGKQSPPRDVTPRKKLLPEGKNE